MRIKIDFKSFTMIFMLFILLISCSPSGNTIPADENNQSPPKEELSSSSIVFSISHNQFEAEKSILACLNLLNNNNEIIVDGILSDDYIFDDITIKKGSKVYFSSLSTSRNLMDKIENIDIALKVTTDEKTFDVKYLGTISDNKIETEIFNVDNEEFSSTPASLICSTDIDSLYSLIKDFCLGKEPSEEFKIYKDESFLDSWNTGKGWIVFSSKLFDEAKHKINFTLENKKITSMIMDGWCEIIQGSNGTSDLTVSENPLFKGDVPLTDEEALELSSMLMAFYLYMQVQYPLDTQTPEFEWIGDNLGWEFKLNNLYVPTFFGKPVYVSGTETQSNNRIRFDLQIGTHKVELSILNDFTLELLSIDEISYNYLGDAVFQRISECYYIIRPFWDMFGYFLYGYDKNQTSENKPEFTERQEGLYSIYEFNNTDLGTLFSPILTGVLKISDSEFLFDLKIENPGLYDNISLLPVIQANGIFKRNRKCPVFKNLRFLETEHSLSDFELNAYNVLYEAFDTFESANAEK